MTVAKDERTFSKLKTVKNLCISRTSNERLEELMFMACKKDIVDDISVHELATLWAGLKSSEIIAKILVISTIYVYTMNIAHQFLFPS